MRLRGASFSFDPGAASNKLKNVLTEPAAAAKSA